MFLNVVSSVEFKNHGLEVPRLTIFELWGGSIPGLGPTFVFFKEYVSRRNF